MVKMETITPIEDRAEWVSSLFFVEKPICLDPSYLNHAIKRPHFIMPTTEEILARMSNAKFFSKLDASNAYWQIPVADESSKLLTFNSSNGRYRFLSMPYGIHSASVCQNRIYQMFENTEGAANSQDDIIIWGETIDELKNRTIKFLNLLESRA